MTDSDILKAKMSIIYGDNVEVLFDSFVFVWDEIEKQPGKHLKTKGILLFATGEKLIKDEIDMVIPIKHSNNGKIEVIAYAIMLPGYINSIYNVKPAEGYKILSIPIITNESAISRAKLKTTYYSKNRPEITLEYKFKVFIGKFNQCNEITSFIHR